jgi:hypothetical protein
MWSLRYWLMLMFCMVVVRDEGTAKGDSSHCALKTAADQG